MRLDKPIREGRDVSGKEAIWTTIQYKGVTYNLQAYIDYKALDESIAALLDESSLATTADSCRQPTHSTTEETLMSDFAYLNDNGLQGGMNVAPR